MCSLAVYELPIAFSGSFPGVRSPEGFNLTASYPAGYMVYHFSNLVDIQYNIFVPISVDYYLLLVCTFEILYIILIKYENIIYITGIMNISSNQANTFIE